MQGSMVRIEPSGSGGGKVVEILCETPVIDVNPVPGSDDPQGHLHKH